MAPVILWVVDLDRMSIADPDRYIRDAQELSQLLAGHYHQETIPHAFSPLTMVELISVIHLSSMLVKRYCFGYPRSPTQAKFCRTRFGEKRET